MSCRSLAGTVLALARRRWVRRLLRGCPDGAAWMDHMTPIAGVDLEPFTFRAPLDPYQHPSSSRTS